MMCLGQNSKKEVIGRGGGRKSENEMEKEDGGKLYIIPEGGNEGGEGRGKERLLCSPVVEKNAPPPIPTPFHSRLPRLLFIHPFYVCCLKSLAILPQSQFILFSIHSKSIICTCNQINDGGKVLHVESGRKQKMNKNLRSSKT
jgi:hypothetical protein